MPRRVPLVLALAMMLAAPAARADVADVESTYDPGPATRRSDFAAGITLGGMVGGVTGYPNKPEKIDNAEFRASARPAGGAGGGFWLGGAIRDYLVLGLGVTLGSIAGRNAALSNGSALVAHIEAFPLFYRGGAWRDVAIVGEFGAGNRQILSASRKAADGGMMSYVSLGFLYEPLRIGDHVSAGPTLMVSNQFSPSLNAFFATAGIRLVFYGTQGSGS